VGLCRREGLGRWLMTWAPGLNLKHVEFAEETIRARNLDPDKLKPPEVLQLMYMLGFNPTNEAMDEVYKKIAATTKTRAPSPEFPEATLEKLASGLGMANIFGASPSMGLFGASRSSKAPGKKPKAKADDDDTRYVDLRGFLRIWAEYRSISEKEELLLVQVLHPLP
jgi:hypothetical protein